MRGEPTQTDEWWATVIEQRPELVVPLTSARHRSHDTHAYAR